MMHQQQSTGFQRDMRGVGGGALLIAIGLVVLVQRYTPLHLGALLWPFFIIGPGCLLYLLMLLNGRGSGTLAIPATVVTTLGLILLGQSLFDYFESWAYIWALLPTAAGAGMVIGGLWDGKAAMVRFGMHTARGGVTMLLIFATFFELFIFHSATFLVILWPVALIGGGAFLLLRGRLNRPAAPDRWLATTAPTPTAKDDDGQLFPY
jgi:hypothetical protein